MLSFDARFKFAVIVAIVLTLPAVLGESNEGPSVSGLARKFGELYEACKPLVEELHSTVYAKNTCAHARDVMCTVLDDCSALQWLGPLARASVTRAQSGWFESD